MISGLLILLLVMAGFVGSHFLLSHPLRAGLVSAMGEGGFQAFYSVIALLFLAGIAATYHFLGAGPALWSDASPGLELVFSLAGYIATVLFMGSLVGNPALVGADLNGLSARLPFGALRVTRHPMMFAIALWSAAQILLIPSGRNLIAGLGLIVLALVGARLQDVRKAKASPREWNAWTGRTSFWPNVREFGHLGWAFIIGLVPWLLLTWLESRALFAPVGIWYFVPQLAPL
jgi:uncharacterized membrane protein